jgi:nitrogenase iron protein NifH
MIIDNGQLFWFSELQTTRKKDYGMKKVAVYGKGGIGKSTTVANLAAALSLRGLKVMQIGCDPKADSTKYVMRGVRIPTVLDCMKRQSEGIGLTDLVYTGFNGVLCAEAGGPTPGIGCAGRGIITAFEKLEELRAFETYQPDIVLYDVLGDVVCGGFAMPLREGYAEDVYIVTSGEAMALYAAVNIATAVNQFRSRGYARLKGLILNSREIPDEVALVKQTATELDTKIIQQIPRDHIVQKAEAMGLTVVEAFLDSAQSLVYQDLASRII